VIIGLLINTEIFIHSKSDFIVKILLLKGTPLRHYDMIGLNITFWNTLVIWCWSSPLTCELNFRQFAYSDSRNYYFIWKKWPKLNSNHFHWNREKKCSKILFLVSVYFFITIYVYFCFKLHPRVPADQCKKFKCYVFWLYDLIRPQWSFFSFFETFFISERVMYNLLCQFFISMWFYFFSSFGIINSSN
jgi:hypothetical protein